MSDVTGQTAFLTGAGEGLGREIAFQLAAAGMRVALFDIQADKLHAVATTLTDQGADVFPVVVDLADAAATQEAAEAALARFGTPRALIHNAALLREVAMLDVTFEAWRRETNIIMQGAFVLSRAVWPGMTDAGVGSIIFVSSGSALSGFVKETAYTPGKHGQEGLMKVLSLEGAAHNIAVNTITTGAPIDTPMSASHYTEEMKIGMVPPSALAPAFAFLAGIDAQFATGYRFNAYQLSEAMRTAQSMPDLVT